jgi:hypothetical protein
MDSESPEQLTFWSNHLVIFQIKKIKLFTNYFHFLPVECGRSKFMSLSRITGGSEATPNEFPWMVRFLLRNLTSGEISTCAGTLVSDRHVITAPHCFYNSFSPLIFGVEVVNITLGAHDFMGANSSDQYRQFADWGSMTFSGNFSNPMDNCINVITLRTPLILNGKRSLTHF